MLPIILGDNVKIEIFRNKNVGVVSMKGATIKLDDICLLSEMSKKYIGTKIHTLHRDNKRDIQRSLCKIVGKKSARKNLISDLSEHSCVKELRIFYDSPKSTKIFLIIDSPKMCKILSVVNETDSFAKDIMIYQHGIEEWVIYSKTIENLDNTIKKLKENDVKVKVEKFFDLPIDMVFTRNFDFLTNMKLTERQLELLKAAWKLGYYDKQKKINLNEIAKKFGVSEPTIWESLRCAEYKIMLSLSDYFNFEF